VVCLSLAKGKVEKYIENKAHMNKYFMIFYFPSSYQVRFSEITPIYFSAGNLDCK